MTPPPFITHSFLILLNAEGEILDSTIEIFSTHTHKLLSNLRYAGALCENHRHNNNQLSTKMILLHSQRESFMCNATEFTS
jgi:hypothetical protein